MYARLSVSGAYIKTFKPPEQICPLLLGNGLFWLDLSPFQIWISGLLFNREGGKWIGSFERKRIVFLTNERQIVGGPGRLITRLNRNPSPGPLFLHARALIRSPAWSFREVFPRGLSDKVCPTKVCLSVLLAIVREGKRNRKSIGAVQVVELSK